MRWNVKSKRTNGHAAGAEMFGQLEDRRLLTAMLALGTDNLLLRFDSASPGTIQSGLVVTGLLGGEKLLGVDFRPATNTLFGLGAAAGATNHLYTIDLNTGAASLVGAITGMNLLATDGIAFDFNPTVDRIRVIDSNNGNWRVNPSTGALAATDTSIVGGSRIAAAAYTNNFAGATVTTLYALDDLNNRLVILNPPNSGTIVPVGATGVDFTNSAGFDIDAGGTAWASLRISTGANSFGTINLTTGAFTLVGTIGGSTTLNIIGVTSIPTQNAPTITGGLTPSLTSVAEDSGAGAGTIINDLLASAGGDLITDANAGALEGIAITAADTTNGSWEYSLNGTVWQSLSDVFSFHALLLPADGVARVRFTPSVNFNGTITSALTFRAWDRTTGSSGVSVDTSSNGGSTAFSTATVGATINVTPVYDAPFLGGLGTKQGEITDSSTFVPYQGLGITYVDSTSQTMTTTVSVAPPEFGVFTAASLAASGFVAQVTPGQYAFTGTAAASTIALRALVFDPANNLAEVGVTTGFSIQTLIDDGIGPDVNASPLAYFITSANDAPTIAGLTPSNTIGVGSNVRPFRRMRFTDPDLNDTLTTLVVLDKPLKGTFTSASLTASGFTRVSRGRFQFVGTPAAATAAIRKLRYQFNANLASGQVHRVRCTVSVTDESLAAASNNTTTVTLGS